MKHEKLRPLTLREIEKKYKVLQKDYRAIWMWSLVLCGIIIILLFSTHFKYKCVSTTPPTEQGAARVREEGTSQQSVRFTPEYLVQPGLPSPVLQPTLKKAGSPSSRLGRLFAAIRQVESGGNDMAVGDGGWSKGPYQISAAYWEDATKHGRYQWDYLHDVWSRAKSEQIMIWYWQRYCPDALANLDYETLTRVHNGGPRWMHKPPTIKARTRRYWQKVKKVM